MPASPPTAGRAGRPAKGDPHLDADLAPDLIVPEISNRLVCALLLRWEQQRGHQAIAALVEGAGLPPAYLQDQQRFVSASYIAGLARTWARQQYGLRELPGHDHPVFAVWREIGQQDWNGRSGGALLSLIRALGSPADIYSHLPGFTQRSNRLLDIERRPLGRGHVRILCRSADPSRYSLPSDACWYLLGLLEGVPTQWGLPPAQVLCLDCCQRDPSLDGCTYDVRFTQRSLVHPFALIGGVLQSVGVLGGRRRADHLGTAGGDIKSRPGGDRASHLPLGASTQ